MTRSYQAHVNPTHIKTRSKEEPYIHVVVIVIISSTSSSSSSSKHRNMVVYWNSGLIFYTATTFYAVIMKAQLHTSCLWTRSMNTLRLSYPTHAIGLTLVCSIRSVRAISPSDSVHGKHMLHSCLPGKNVTTLRSHYSVWGEFISFQTESKKSGSCLVSIRSCSSKLFW